MENETEISLKNLTKKDLMILSMGVNHMKEIIRKETWSLEMYGAAVQVSEKLEQAMKECGMIKTIEYNI